MEEIWTNIKDFENCYQISNLGRVKSLARVDKRNRKIEEKVLKPRKHSAGYLRVSLNRKDFYIHRLVAEAFIPNLQNKAQVNHVDGNKQNNRVDNLEWCTSSENNAHAVRIGLNKKDISFMKEMANCENHKNAMKKKRIFTKEQILNIRTSKETDSMIAKKYNVSSGQIYNIRHYRTYKEITQ